MRRALVLLSIVALVGGPGAGSATAAISGTVTDRSQPPRSIAGAVVTVGGPGQAPLVRVTEATGAFSIPVGGGGPYGVGVQAVGFAGQSAGRVQDGAALAFALDRATFAPLPANAGLPQAVVADATSGIFYALMFAPEVYRTVDYGGSWRPVTMSYDDADSGLRNTEGNHAIAVSSVSGEIAVLGEGSGAVYFSRDYGVSWRTVGGDVGPGGPGPPRPPLLFWAHASPTAPSVLLVAHRAQDGSWAVWRADMSSDAPAFVREPADPFGTGSMIDVADSAGGSFVGRVSASGALAFAPLSAGASIAFGPDEATGLPASPQLLRLGGAKEASAPPDGALVGGGSPFVAQMLTKAAGAPSFAGASSSAAMTLPASCTLDFRAWATGSVTPTTTGASGAGNVGNCWLRKDGADLTVFTRGPDGDLAFDAAWGQPGNLVAISATSPGPLKLTELDADGVPVVAPAQRASDGTAPASAGSSLQGITSPNVFDTDHGPAVGGRDLAAAGAYSLASKDGGQTVTEVLPLLDGDSNAVQWWQGASGEWLVFGHGSLRCDRNTLSAVLNWNGVTLASRNVSGSACSDLGGPATSEPPATGYGVVSLEPVPDTDTVFIGAAGEGTGGFGQHLFRGRLTRDGDAISLTDRFSFDQALGSTTLYRPNAMAYCPPSSAHPDMQDVLFVATGHQSGPQPGPGPGGLLRITRATTGDPAVAVVASVPHDTPGTLLSDVRADCARGVVYTGGAGSVTDQTATYLALHKSEPGGRTFTQLRVALPPVNPGSGITAIGLNPANPDDVTVAGTDTGFTVNSLNGGAEGTWTVIHDPAVKRAARVFDIEVTSPAAGSSMLGALTPAWPAQRGRASAPSALVGTSSGIFRGDAGARSGVIALTEAPGARARVGVRITTPVSDGRPALAPSASGAPIAILRRTNGLHETSESGGSWSAPSLIPGTTRADDFPAAALDAAGRLHVAFTRRGRAPGIYVTTRGTDGSWVLPRRISARAGDALPAIAAVGRRIDVAFLRTRGSSRGIFHAANRRGRWRSASKVRGTAAADAIPAFGGPSLSARRGTLHLAFARARGAPGIYYTAMRGPRWSRPRRLTAIAGDAQPSLVAGARGERNIVFRRRRGRSRGLFGLTGRRTWSLARIPGTARADTEPVLATNGPTLILAFARPSGTAPGIYFDQRRRGRWLRRPQRWSRDAGDRNPALRSHTRGRVTLVFERG